MTLFLIILGSILTYLLIGGISARVQLPAIVADNTFSKGDKYHYGVYNIHTGFRDKDGVNENDVKLDLIFATLLWPYDIPSVLFDKSVTKAIEKYDPRAAERRLKESQARTAELERELGMR